MEENRIHIPIANTLDNAYLPLYDFFLLLKRNNFMVTPEQITDANKVLSQYAHHVKNELELCGYLAPIFVNSEEQQILFKQIFEAYFQTHYAKERDGSRDTNTNAWVLIPILLVLAFLAWVVWNKEPLKTDKVHNITYCKINASITISKSFKGDSVRVRTPITLTATIKGQQPDSIQWSNTNAGILENSNTNKLLASISTPGIKQFSCKAFYKQENDLCSISDTIVFKVYDNIRVPTVNFVVSENANPVALKNKVLSHWYYISGALALLSLYLTILFAKWYNALKRQRGKNIDKNKELYNDLIDSFSGSSGAIEVPFHDKGFLVSPEPELRTIAAKMRKRISDDVPYMHIEKTISKIIQNGGFFDPVIATRTQQSEFLVLVGKERGNPMLLKLIDVLIDILKSHNVYIDKYYFGQNILNKCFSEEGVEISLEKLSEKYPEHILLIFGEGYKLIYTDYPSLNRYAMQLLNRWQYKAVVTPVSFMDWGVKEKKILLPSMPVLPIDIFGQLKLMQVLFGEDQNILSLLDKSSDGFYDVETVDFEDIDELLDYCSEVDWSIIPNGSKYSNVLFQWVAALAVYPKINWELTLDIGKAILEKYDVGQELNFTTLLKVVRIHWIRAGNFPDFMRLELLKHLSAENEVIARETILRALNEIPPEELNPTHFAYEEKETQRIINEFNLYAYDSAKYAHYKDAKSLFSKLYEEDLISDVTAKNYFENNSLSWETLINKKVVGDNSVQTSKNIPLKAYFEEKPERRSTKEIIYQWATALASLLSVASLLGLISLIFLNISGNYEFSPFTNVSPIEKDIEISYNSGVVSDLQSNNDVVFSVDDSSFKLIEESNNSLGDSLKSYINIPVLIDGIEKKVSVSWNDKTVFDSLTHITHDSYDVVMAIPPPLDSDGDGVLDVDDECPNIKGNIENYGCPWKDTDGDGIPDKDDKCPKEKGSKRNYGCPDDSKPIKNDRDGDGIPDKEDKCPNTPGPKINKGCPLKVEKKSVDISKIKTTTQLKKREDSIRQRRQVQQENVQQQQQQQLDSKDIEKTPVSQSNLGAGQNTQTNLADSDGDGVLDKDDKCPDVRGTVANNGCPESAEETQVPAALNEYAKVVLFDSGKATIGKRSEPALYDILKILKEYPEVNFVIEGHTDDRESKKSKNDLSEDRAKYVQEFLVSNGISSSRLSTIGYGNSRPIASNKTRDGRAMNRRVEVNLAR